jgi:ammonium transporter, Amt family
MYTLEPRRLAVPALAAFSLLTPALALAEEPLF